MRPRGQQRPKGVRCRQPMGVWHDPWQTLVKVTRDGPLVTLEPVSEGSVVQKPLGQEPVAHGPVAQELVVRLNEGLAASEAEKEAFPQVPDTTPAGYLSRGDHNVWLVDWRPLSGARYRCSVVGVPDAARHVAAAIHSLGLPERKIHLVGHSMGAQLAATVGKLFQGRLHRITALDPALPLFSILSHVTSISAGDAQNVDVIHTDGGIYGIMGPVGTVDFYPNAGTRRQPGCSPELILINDLCSHHRSFMMYAESLMRPMAFPAVWCTSWKEFTSGNCNNTQTAYMGILATTESNTRGSYFLRTSTSFPFGLGKEGIYVPQLPTTASPLPENEIRGHSG
ncbi:pancreatic triacylglycerol lipase-like [Schistocerca nitens]|uniref:pancreatic triacylglycerol lipase-like n=1 Tax=Schistocerca nitens TaxID=7011 RepID=UPI002117FFD8|nr:pancreatic triacylglycerol lipase-like [Schistocerca nitens]